MPHQVVVVAGWYPDPSTRHEFRYWDGVAWTEHVADAGRASVDAVGSAPAVGAGVPSAGSSPDPTFSPEVRRELEARGYVIYRLTGKSIADLQAAGRTIHILTSQGAEDVDREEPSLHSEVAMYAQADILSIACGKDYPDQQAEVDAVNERWVRTACPGAVAIIGNAADYACLIFEHLEATRPRAPLQRAVRDQHQQPRGRSGCLAEVVLRRRRAPGVGDHRLRQPLAWSDAADRSRTGTTRRAGAPPLSQRRGSPPVGRDGVHGRTALSARVVRRDAQSEFLLCVIAEEL